MARTPQISIPVPTWSAHDPHGWQHLFDRAKAADAAGFDRLVVSDHVVFGENLEAYARPELGGSVGGKQPTGPDGHWLEPVTTLSVLAGMTSQIRLGTNILLAALRRPVTLAKSLSTLDVLSGGRVDIGVGVGWQREEYEAAGLGFDKRGQILDHTLAVCQTLWRDQTASFNDDLLSFDRIHMMPKPMQPGGVTIWVSGTVNARVARRIARFGSGWIPWGPAQKDVQSGIKAMWELVAAEGRDPSDLAVVGILPVVKTDSGAIDIGRTMDAAPRLVAAGVTDCRIAPPLPDDASAAADVLVELANAFRTAVA